MAAGLALAAAPAAITPFSSAQPGSALPRGWELLTVPNIAPPEAMLVAEEGATVLRLRSHAAAGSVAHRLDADPGARLAWRWKVDRVVEKADLARREGDDYAARLYVTFDVPESELTFGERARRTVARWVYGAELPTAAICYVWDNRHPPGTVAPNPYTPQVRMMVLDSGPAQAGRWVAHARDLSADFRAAFGSRFPGPVPRVTGVAVSADTDQTGESVTAWFGDLAWVRRP